MIVNDTLFDNTDKYGFPKQSSSYISVSNGAGSLNISNSTFTDSGASAIRMISSGTLTVDGSIFSNNDESGIEYRGGNKVAISNTTIQNNGDGLFGGNGGVFINGSAGVTVTNSLFTGNNVDSSLYISTTGGSALALNNVSTATVTNCTFDGNKSIDSGFRLPGEPATSSFNTGGAAILALQTNTLTVTSSLFRNNQVLNIDQENSGGGAIYDFNGALTITNCGFENNSISITGYPVNSPNPDTTDYQLNPQLQPSARYSGGGAVYAGGSTTIQGTYFSDNSVLNQVDFWQHAIDEKATPSKPMYSGGGALYLTSNGQATINNLYNLTFTGNSAIQTGAVSDTRLSGRGSAYVPLGASPTALLLGNYGGGFNTSALTINANNQSFSVASQSGFGGNYKAAAPVSMPAMPSGATGAVAQGDFNGDGNPDFVVANPLVNSISLYLGTNTGSFQLASSHSVGTTPGANPIALTTGDFNNDGNIDVAVANSGETSITVLFGTGFGAFGTVTNLTPTGSPVAVAAGDFNNDGFVDLTAITSTGTLNQFNWDSLTSSFKAAKSTTFTSTPASLVLGDVNADGFLDAAVADSGAALVHIYFGQANSTFINNPLTDDYNTGAGSDPRVARLANLNPTVDAFLDLIVPLHGYNQVAIYSNLGTGVFGTPTPYNVQVGPVDAQAGKLSFFGNNVDLVVASDTASSLSILYGTGTGSFLVTQAPTGRGLNGGAMIIADGRAVGAPNNVNFNAFNGSSTTNIINVTVTGNSLVNPFATNVNSNFSTAGAQGSGLNQWVNTTDTGGIFIDTNTGSSTITTNTILTGNTGLDYLSSSGFFNGIPSTVISNTGRRYFADGYGSFQSKASSMYDPSTTYGFNNNGSNVAGSFVPAPGDITQSADTTNLDPKGLQTDVRAPQIGLTSNPLYQGTIKYIPIDRLSPARDAGTSVNVYPA
ncbi:MAG: beta strand repeat-containing protein, partial [Planctomycetota bacterium]